MTFLVLDAFTIWWVMNEPKSLLTLSSLTGIPLHKLRHHARTERWEQRRQHLDEKLSQLLEEGSASSIELLTWLMAELLKGRAAEGLLRFRDDPQLGCDFVTSGTRILLSSQQRPDATSHMNEKSKAKR